MEVVSLNKCFGGTQGVYKHHSAVCQCDMSFGLFLPPG
ncbi:MAG: S-formylglutathione hydrolase, partial [Rhodobacteraceae bacterium]|nr:S-formylglutathione hydrolase [Paracoccaceae bacterium]